METLVIRSNSKENIKLLFGIAKKMGEKPEIENQSLQSIKRGVSEAKQIISGKKKAISLDSVLNAKD